MDQHIKKLVNMEVYLGSCQGVLRNKLYSLVGSIGHSEYCSAIATL